MLLGLPSQDGQERLVFQNQAGFSAMLRALRFFRYFYRKSWAMDATVLLRVPREMSEKELNRPAYGQTILLQVLSEIETQEVLHAMSMIS